MKEFLKSYLKSQDDLADDSRVNWEYTEDVNNDVLNNTGSHNGNSFIYKVGVLCAINANKYDFVKVAIGTQRSEYSEPALIGPFLFHNGENDDIDRVLERFINAIRGVHPIFN